MKLLSWNVNGIRAIERKGNFEEVIGQNWDVLCFQETKAEVEQLSKKLLETPGYHADFWSSQERKGHAGVVTYSKNVPRETVFGGIRTGHEFDTAGRILTSYFPVTLKDGTESELVVINCYFPNGADRAHHDVGGGLEYKIGFYERVLSEVEQLRVSREMIVICGDFNVAHTEIDLARPKENKNSIGFLPVERDWLTRLLALGWVDTFRDAFPDKLEVYTWWDVISKSRLRNVGWRIDYVVVTDQLMLHVKHPQVLGEQLGSDHCPVTVEFGFKK